MDGHCDLWASAILKMRQHADCRPVLPFVFAWLNSQILMEQTFCDRSQQRVSVGLKRVVAQAKKLKQAIDQKGLRELKGRRIELRDLNP